MDRARGQTLIDNSHSGKLGICVSVAVFGIFISCTLLAFPTCTSATTNNTLEQLVFVFRHGNRTPLSSYPKDPYQCYPWPGGWGVLTEKGKHECYDLGQWIRKTYGIEYGGIISTEFENASTLIRSSHVHRCIMSADALCAGLYGPTSSASVHPIPKEVDNLIAVSAPCPKLSKILQQVYLNESKNTNNTMNEYYKNLTELSGMQINITEVAFLYNILHVEAQHGLILPKPINSYYHNKYPINMSELFAYYLALFTKTTDQQRLMGGPLLKEILSKMEEVGTDFKPKRSYFYSGHDKTIINILNTLGFSELFAPDYAATLIFELHLTNNNSDREVKVLYLNNTETKNPHLLEIPNCPSPCSLQTLKKVLHEVIPNNWTAECQI